MTFKKIANLELDILINDEDKGNFYLGCTKCRKTTKNWDEFFNHLFSHLTLDMESVLNMETWEVKK